MCSIYCSVVLLHSDCAQGAMVRLGQVRWGYKEKRSYLFQNGFRKIFQDILHFLYHLEDCSYLIKAIILDLISDLLSLKFWFFYKYSILELFLAITSTNEAVTS